MSNYYDKRDAKVRIAHELMNRGWNVEGYSPDESDSMTDYYSPAHWGGIATKNGFVLVVDNRYTAEAKEITKYNPKGNLSFEDREKINKLEAMTVERGCTEGEEENAKKLIEKIQSKISDVSAYEVIGMTTAHMGNPKGSIWHIEKDGKIYDKGNALTKFSDIPESYVFDINKMEYTNSYKMVKEWDNNESGFKWVERILPDETKKVINDFKALILRFERVVNNLNGMGDGTKETEQKAQEQQTKEGYKKVTVTETKTGLKMVEVTDRKTIQVGDYLTFNYHGGYWKVTDAGQRTGTWKIKGVPTKLTKNTFSYENVGAESRGFQQLKNAKRYYDYEERLNKGIENGTTKIYELKEVTEVVEVEKWVKIDQSKKTYNTTNKENKQETKEAVTEQKEKTEVLNHEITITADTDTRDDSQIWVVKVVDKLSNEEYKKVAEQFKVLKGYYSKFKHGFIFKYDPTNILKPNEEQQAENVTETYNEIAESIIDMSFNIITDLNINGSTICNNEEYKTKMYDYIKNNNIDITADVINYMKPEEAYNNLIEVIEQINSAYYHPIRNGFMYDCHFKEWDIPMQEIKDTITALNISFIDCGEKIGFKGLTADQTRQIKEISDINGSILFIDNEISEDEYNRIDNNSTADEVPEIEVTEEQETESNNVIDFEEYKNNSEVEQMKTTNNSNDFNFDDIMNQFDNIEIKQTDKISPDDRIFCELHEKIYTKAYNAYKEVLTRLEPLLEEQKQETKKAQEKGIIKQYDNYEFDYISTYSDGGISDIKKALKQTTVKFVNSIIYYFKKKYQVDIKKDYSDDNNKFEYLTIDYVLDNYIFAHLDGLTFKEKAIQEIKEKAKMPLHYYNYRNYWNYEVKGKTIKFRTSIDNIMPALYFYDSNESLILDCYSHNKVDDYKTFENGNTDIKFKSSIYALEFAKKYLGYLEMTDDEKEIYKKKCSNW